MKYHHLTLDQRYLIEFLRSTGCSQRVIAESLGVNKSTISCELRRNRAINSNGKLEYRAGTAHEIAKQICSAVGHLRRKIKGELEHKIVEKLQLTWSPEQIAGRLKMEEISVSYETIYKYVREHPELYKCLRHGGKRRKPRNHTAGRSLIPNRVDIAERPKVVEAKERLGDWEGDTVISHKSHCVLVTLVERKTKYLLMKKLENKNMENVGNAIINMLKNNNISAQTITFDNGMEFADHEKITKKTGAKIFFARPYKSCDRGLNEHTNGLIRQFLRKREDFWNVSDKKIVEIQNLLNNRPRKVLDYLTPVEVLRLAVAGNYGVALHP